MGIVAGTDVAKSSINIEHYKKCPKINRRYRHHCVYMCTAGGGSMEERGTSFTCRSSTGIILLNMEENN